MVKLACPACSKMLRFQEKYLGRKIHCPQCGHPQVLARPADDADHEPTQGPPVNTPESRSPLATSPIGTPNPDRSESFATQMPMTLAMKGNDSDHRRPKGIPFAGSFLAPPEAPDEIGRLGGYRILSQLGAGGMGVVFLAEDVHLNRKIALKALPPDANDDPAARDRFKREAQAAALLEHENIITVHQVGEDRGVMFLAMPLLKGKPLDEYLRDNGDLPLPLDEVLQIGREIAAGLSAAHDKGVIHRDVKPANIWLEDLAGRSTSRQRFRVKILDFGLARRARDTGLTQSGIIVGTPSYMSPEQARGPKVDGRSDLFSLGCVLYEISTGRRAFAGSDAISVLSSLAADIPLPPAELNPEIPFELSDLILELLEKDAANRPATARDVEDRLLAFDSRTDESSQTTRLSSSKSKPPRKKTPPSYLWMWISGGSLTVCLLVGVLVWAVSSSPAPPKALKDKVIKDGKVKDGKEIDEAWQKKMDDLKAIMDAEKKRDDEEKLRKDAERDDNKDRKKRDDFKDPLKKGKKGFDPPFGFNAPREQPSAISALAPRYVIRGRELG